MEPELLNLVVLPLLGGYVFFSRLHWTSFAAKKIEGQRLLYGASVSLISVFLILAARAVEMGFAALDQDPMLNARLVSIFLSLTLITQAAAGLTLGVAALSSELDQKRDPEYRPDAAKACAALLLLLLIPLYLRFFEAQLLHVFALPTVFLAVLLACQVAAWVKETSSQSAATAVIRVVLLMLALSCGTTFVLIHGVGIGHWWSSEFSSITHSGVALLAAAIGAVAWMPINVILTDRWGWRWAHEAGQSSGLELLLYRAWKRRSAIQLTLKDGKVYIGFVAEMPIPKPNLDGCCIELIPISSGYRRADKTVCITTDYTGVINKICAEAAKQDRDVKAALKPAFELLSKVIPISEVSVAALYSDDYTATDLTALAAEPNSGDQPRGRPAAFG